jgi:hypothetical protein
LSLCVGKPTILLPVIPAKAGIQPESVPSAAAWIPAFAGMTKKGAEQ